MEIIDVDPQKKSVWNLFVKTHYPPIGAFMQTWEWGDFQIALGRKIGRYFITHDSAILAAFTLVHYSLPLGFSYGYIPRGPVIAVHVAKKKEMLLQMLENIRSWAIHNFPDHLFLRLEPPILFPVSRLRDRGFRLPAYYVQPKHNLGIFLGKDEEIIFSNFHSSTRSNIHRAEKRGVRAEIRPSLGLNDRDQFFTMVKDTIKRHGGKNAYPSFDYFHSFFKAMPPLSEKYDPCRLSLGVFYGYQYDKLAGIHFVLFFGDTATYIYGASRNDMLSSKVATYLHWFAAREARKKGLQYYDLGGIDKVRWPTLTNFKKQFRGEEISYIGNVDIPIRPFLYRMYNIFRRMKSK